MDTKHYVKVATFYAAEKTINFGQNITNNCGDGTPDVEKPCEGWWSRWRSQRRGQNPAAGRVYSRVQDFLADLQRRWGWIRKSA